MTISSSASSLTVPFLDLKREYQFLCQKGIEDMMLETLRTAHFVEGPRVREFERAFAEFCGLRDSVAVDSGTAALHLGMLALGIGPGDEVIVPANTFIATAAAVAMAGARPVFVDVDPKTWQMDLERLPSLIGPQCKAVIAVHLFGLPVNLDILEGICQQKGLHLVEDAAQAHGARLGARRIGSVGTISCFSFYPSKNLGAFGDGGAVLSNDEQMIERFRRLRNHGRFTKNEHSEVGYNYRMDELQGGVLRMKLRYLDEWNARRRHYAERYRNALASQGILMPLPLPAAEPVWHLFPIAVERRDDLAAFLRERGVDTGIHYPVPLHLQPAFSALGHKRGDFPVVERLAQQMLSLPISAFHTDEQIDYVCHCIGEFYARSNGTEPDHSRSMSGGQIGQH
jgi:dTDP-4-amino-4,6-dideoxygalactose transaminase